MKPTFTRIIAAMLLAVAYTNAHAWCIPDPAAPTFTAATAGAGGSSASQTYVFRTHTPGIQGPALPSSASAVSGTPATLTVAEAYMETNTPYDIASALTANGVNMSQPVTATVILLDGAISSGRACAGGQNSYAVSFSKFKPGSVITLINKGNLAVYMNIDIMLAPGVTLNLDNSNGTIYDVSGATTTPLIKLNGGTLNWLGGSTAPNFVGTVIN